jgi:putative hydrolase of the HAD superfamily
MPVQVLLFDLGGVLIDIDFERVFQAWAAHSTLPIDELRRRFVIDATYERHERGELAPSHYLDHVRRLLALDADDQAVADGWNAVFVGEIAETVALVRAVRRHLPCFVLTNTNPIHQQAWSNAYPGLISLFEQIFVSSELGMRKPEQRAYRSVATAIGVDPAAILFFDDLQQNVDGARSAGMQAVQVSGPQDIRRELARTGLV